MDPHHVAGRSSHAPYLEVIAETRDEAEAFAVQRGFPFVRVEDMGNANVHTISTMYTSKSRAWRFYRDLPIARITNLAEGSVGFSVDGNPIIMTERGWALLSDSNRPIFGPLVVVARKLVTSGLVVLIDDGELNVGFGGRSDRERWSIKVTDLGEQILAFVRGQSASNENAPEALVMKKSTATVLTVRGGLVGPVGASSSASNENAPEALVMKKSTATVLTVRGGPVGPVGASSRVEDVSSCSETEARLMRELDDAVTNVARAASEMSSMAVPQPSTDGRGFFIHEDVMDELRAALAAWNVAGENLVRHSRKKVS